MNATYEQYLTKGNEYVVKDIRGEQIIFKSNISEKHFLWITDIEDNFTIKRYTLTDLKEKKIAVKLRNYAEYKRLCEAVGEIGGDEANFVKGGNDCYGIDNNGLFFWLTKAEQQGRTLIPSIDLIDLEVQEETKEVINEAFYIQKLESEINRLKGEVEQLIEEKRILISQLKESYGIDRQSPDLTKRERMAWEIVINLGTTIRQAFEMTDEFLAKSKEVGNG